MNRTSLFSDLAALGDSPLIYQNGKCILTYSEFVNNVENAPSIAGPYKILVWQGTNTKEFVLEYFTCIHQGITAVLVEEARLKNGDYDLTQLESLPECDTIIFTSGSTGKPKGVMLDISNFMASAKATVNHYRILEHDNWALSLPLYHIGGIMILWRSLIAKASITLSTPNNVIKDILANPQVTIASLVQLQLENTIRASQETRKRFSKLRGIVLGGSKISESILKEAIANNYNLSTSFGATESCAQFLATQFCQNIDILKTSGRPMEGEVTIEDDCAVLSGPAIALGYLGGEKFNGKFKTSDQIKIDKDNNVTILGRRDLIFQKASENINPEILEAKLSKVGSSNYYITPIENAKYENLIGLVFHGPNTLSETLDNCKEVFTNFEMPHLIYKANSLADYQKGIKIQRTLLKELANFIHLNLGHSLKICASGNPHGEIVIIGHGFMGNSLELDILENLSDKYLLLYIDLPGHGLNHKLKSLDEFKQSIHALLKQIEVINKKVHFITYSMSGRIFNELLRAKELQELQCLGKFINESGAPGFIQDDEAREKRLAHDMNLFDGHETPQDFFSKWYSQGVFAGMRELPQFKEVVETKSHQYLEMKDSWKMISPIISVATQADLRDLSKLPASVTYFYLFGSQDRKYAAYKDSYYGREYKSYEIESASHNTHLMQPSKYLTVIKEILNS